ncbi:MAG: hypothetical protein ACOYI9_13720 [Candidatus Hydrogenedentales bacterium]|jgi:hypothetical protein
MIKHVFVSLCLFGMVALMGCSNDSMKDAIDLTVGGESFTGVIKTDDIRWYKTQLEAKKEYAFIVKSDEYRGSVGAIFSVYLVEDDVQNLMWQEHYDPSRFIQLTHENDDCCEEQFPPYYDEWSYAKQLAVPYFMAPKSGTYYISIEGYTQVNGDKPANTYAYADTLVYSVAVKYAYSPFNPQGVNIEPKPQGAGVPYVNSMIESYEEVFHPISLKQNHTYQVQIRRSDNVYFPEWLDEYGEELSDSMYFTAPYDGTFLLWVEGFGDMFGYAEYGLRVQEDDHGNTMTTSTEIPLEAASTVKGYLGEDDQDWFSITIPGKEDPESHSYNQYRITIDNPEKFNLSGIAPELDDDAQVIPGSYLLIQQNHEYKVSFQVVTNPLFSYLNNQPDGAGAYTISIQKLAPLEVV